MAVAHDSTTESHGSTSGSASESSFQWNHTGASSGVKGVLIFVWNNANANNVTSITYGGVTVPAVTGGEASDTAGEAGRSTAYFLGQNVPQGTQQVIVNRTNNATVMYATASTVLADQDTRVNLSTIQLTTGDAAVTEVAVTDLPGQLTGVNSLRFAAGHFGHQTPPTAGANSTILQSIDVGAQCYLVGRETSAGTGSRSVGFSSGTSDDRAIVSLAVMEAYSPSVAPVSLAGQVVSLALAIGLSVGSLGMTGLAPSLSVGATTIEVPAGAITHTGHVVTHAFLGPTHGVLNLTGYAPVADVFAGFNPAPGAGAINWHGLTPTLDIQSFDTGIAIPAGSLVHTGLLLTPRTGDLILNLGVGEIEFKGPQRPEAIPQPTAGAITYTGLAPGVAIDAPGSNITIVAGSLALTGRAPDRLLTQTIAVPVGAITLTGNHVAVAFKQPSTGSLVWQGLAPTLFSGTLQIAIPVGQLVHGGATLIPTLNTAFVLPIPVGQVVLTGHDPNVATPPSVVVIPNGALTCAGQAPTLGTEYALPCGSLVITGRVLTVLDVVAEQGLPVGAMRFTGYGFELIHSNGSIISSTVGLVRSIGGTGTITRTVSSGVTR